MNIFSAKIVEKLMEVRAAFFLLHNGIPVRLVRKSRINTPDYFCARRQIAFEVSVFHPYTPQEVQQLQASVGKMLGRDTHVFVYGDENYKVKTFIVREGKCQPNMSILRTQYDASSYAKKIYGKIDEEYEQIKPSKKGVLMFYHVTSPFDPLSLGTVYSQVLSDRGSEFPRLTGILIGLSSNPFFPFDFPSYFFVENPHSRFYPPPELEELWTVPEAKTFVRPFSWYTFFKGKRGWNRLTYPLPHY